MRTLYDVQQLLKRFGIFVHLGERIWDIELIAIELRHLHDAQLIDDKTYRSAQLVLLHEHHLEEKQDKSKEKGNHYFG